MNASVAAPDRGRCALLGTAGLALAVLGVYLGVGLEYGFDHSKLDRFVRRWLKLAPLAVPASAVLGWGLALFYAKLLEGKTTFSLMALVLVRAFLHFALFGLLALFAALWTLATAIPRALLKRKPPHPDEPHGLDRALGLPIWFIVLPFVILRLQSEGDGRIPAAIARARLVLWLPFVLGCLLLWTRMESEGSGERVDPILLSWAAVVWLSDYLIVTFELAPILWERERLFRAGRQS